MDKIPTSKNFFNSYSLEEYDEGGYLGLDDKEGSKMLIEFAKLHVVAALKAVYEKGYSDITSWGGNPYTGEGSEYLDEDKILNAYPIDNIK